MHSRPLDGAWWPAVIFGLIVRILWSIFTQRRTNILYRIIILWAISSNINRFSALYSYNIVVMIILFRWFSSRPLHSLMLLLKRGQKSPVAPVYSQHKDFSVTHVSSVVLCAGYIQQQIQISIQRVWVWTSVVRTSKRRPPSGVSGISEGLRWKWGEAARGLSPHLREREREGGRTRGGILAAVWGLSCGAGGEEGAWCPGGLWDTTAGGGEAEVRAGGGCVERNGVFKGRKTKQQQLKRVKKTLH